MLQSSESKRIDNKEGSSRTHGSPQEGQRQYFLRETWGQVGMEAGSIRQGMIDG